MTAFLYNGMAARPYWNASILAPRFIASAFCSGPAVMIILFQVLRKTTKIPIKDEAIWKLAELMAYAMFINLFLLGAELFKEFYSQTQELLYTKYLWFGLGEHRALVPYAWGSLVASVGDEVTVRAAGADAVWVYLDSGALIERCPGADPDRCRVSPGGVELTVRLSVAARHRVLAITGARDLTPSGDFDGDVLAARARGARLELRSILTAAGP